MGNACRWRRRWPSPEWPAGPVRPCRSAPPSAWPREAKIPPHDRIAVDVHVMTRAARSMPDSGACYGAVKAGIDGLVDAKVIPDDGPGNVAWVRLWPATVTGEDALSLVVSAA